MMLFINISVFNDYNLCFILYLIYLYKKDFIIVYIILLIVLDWIYLD